MKTAVVTGATGFIGEALTKELLKRNIKVYAVGQKKEKLEQLCKIGANSVDMNLTNHRLENSIIEPIDVVYHCAFIGGFNGKALRDYELQLKNANLTCSVVESALKIHAKRFVYASTVNVIEAEELLVNQNFRPRYTCVYSAGKIAAEMIGKTLAWNNNMEFISALIAMPFGENNFSETLPNIIIKQLIQKVPPKLIPGENLYDLIYIDDVVNALCAIGERGGDFKQYYVGHRELYTFRTLIEKMRDILSPETDLHFGAYPDPPALDYSKLDLDALYRDTGYEATYDFEKAIKRTAQWIYEQIV